MQLVSSWHSCQISSPNGTLGYYIYLNDFLSFLLVIIYHRYLNSFGSVICTFHPSLWRNLTFPTMIMVCFLSKLYYFLLLIFRIDPSVTIAAVAAVLFTLACLGGAIQTVRYKSSVWWVMIVAATFEAIGFIARVPSARDPESRTIFIISFTLIVLAPVLMAAACYVVFVCIPSLFMMLTNTLKGSNCLPCSSTSSKDRKAALGSSTILNLDLRWLRYLWVGPSWWNQESTADFNYP